MVSGIPEVPVCGKVTDNVARVSIDVLDYAVSQTELRLMPYIQYLVMNGESVDPRKVNDEERAVLATWKRNGWVAGGLSSPIHVSHHFWTAMNAILFEGYIRNVGLNINFLVDTDGGS